MMWPIFASGFTNSLNFLNLWVRRVSMSLLSRGRSTIQIHESPMIPDFYLSRQVSLLLQPSTRQGMHLSTFLENSTMRRVLIFFLKLPC